MNGLEQVLTNNTAAIAIAGIFIYYLREKDKLNRETYKEFNDMIANHLHDANKVISNNTETQLKFVTTLQQLSDCIKALNGKAKRRK